MTTSTPSLRKLNPNPLWTTLPLFDRKVWKRTRFGDVVENLNETCEPEAAGLGRFIGLEHLEPGSLRIRGWGDVKDGTTFTRRCRPGQILFGKRRAYQRKVAVAEFDAVVSGDIYVLAPKDDRLLPKLLPFLCLSERFFQHAVGTSAGSLSPRTNWSSLASFEFELPPLEQQRRIAEILWAMDEVIQSTINLRHSIAVARDAWLADRLEKTPKERLIAMKDVATSIRNGMVGKVAEHYVEKGITYLVSKNVRRNRLKLDEISYVSQEFHLTHRKSQLKPFDILTVQSGHVGETCVVPPDFGVANCHALIITTPRLDLVDPYFVAFYLNSEVGQKQLRKLFIGSALQHINTSELQQVKLPIPSLDEQREISNSMRSMDVQIAACSANFESLVKLRAAFLNEFI